MLKKLFKQKTVPSKDGDSRIPKLSRQGLVKVFELELSNMEDTPVYPLTHQLSIGSEIGNIIIADPSVSPRHATFNLEQGVVSVIDHGSVSGTHINGKSIQPGKMILLEESDVVNVGDLEIRIKVSMVQAPAEEIPEVPEVPSEVPEEVPEEEIEEKPTRAPERPKKTQEVPPPVPADTRSANALIRVLAILGDILISYGILVILMPFDQFRDYLNFVPEMIATGIDTDLKSFAEALLEDYGFLKEMLLDLYQFFSSTFEFVPLLVMYATLRLVSTLILGASLSQYMLGTRALGNGIWARVGGVIREIVGFFTAPLLILDLPSVVSRRTFKELLTFTHLVVPSKFKAILGILLYLPLTLCFVVLSPLMQGLEPPEPIFVDDRIEQRIKVVRTEEAPTEETPVEEAPMEVPVAVDVSTQLGVKLSYNPDEVNVFPKFKFRMIKNKLNLNSGLEFYHKDLQRSVEWEVLKTFDMKQLLGIGMKGNPFLFDKYPAIYSFVFEPEMTNNTFKKQETAADQNAFANEFITFTKAAFSLSANNALEVMQTETLLLKNFIDYRQSFLALIEYKDWDTMGFMKMGDTIFMKISYVKQKPFDLLIPLNKGPGKIFKVTFDGKDNLSTLSSKFYKFTMNETTWSSGMKKEVGEGISSLGLYDLVSSENVKRIIESPELAQEIYGHFYEKSAKILEKGDSVELEIWKENASNFQKLIEAIPAGEATEEVGPKDKLIQNFRDLMDALMNNNREYFGIAQNFEV